MCVVFAWPKTAQRLQEARKFPRDVVCFMRYRVESWCVLIQLPRHRGRRLPHDASPALARSKLWPPVNDGVPTCVVGCKSQTHSCLATPEHVVVPLLRTSWVLVLNQVLLVGTTGPIKPR